MNRRGALGWLSLLGLGATGLSGVSAADSPPPKKRPPQPSANAPIWTLKVKGDRNVEVVFGPLDGSEVIVYLHGVCGDPLAFGSWAKAAGKHATLISMRGDEPCEKRKGRFQWSYAFAALERRIDRAIAAAEEARSHLVDSVEPAPLTRDGVVLMGYSQGAHRVEAMAHRFPARFSRVALMAPAREPDAAKLQDASRVLLVAGEKDAKKHIQAGRDALEKQGQPVKYLELPGAGHGEYGPEAQRVMAEGLDWLYK